MSPDRLREIGGLGGDPKERKQQQRIIPAVNFTCQGTVTKWIVAAKWNGKSDMAELQIWRKLGAEGTYTKSQATTITASVESNTGIYEFDVSGSNPLVTFQEGDILGIFTPKDSRLRPYFSERYGPPNYYIDTGMGSTAGTTFQINEEDVQYDVPLVTVEVSKFTHQNLLTG